MDGRYPTDSDYDYMSEMIGSDFIRISSTDSLFSAGGSAHTWDPKVGIMVVVAVFSRNDDIKYSLTVSGPYPT